MDRTQSIGARVFPCLLVLIALTSATNVFAQGQNGILTGIVADGDGVVPGATVTRHRPDDRPRSHGGVERPGHLPRAVRAGRTVHAEGRNGRVQADHAERVMVISGETRDLGRLVLEVGTLAEAVTVTAEVTPVNTTTGSLQRNMTGDQLTMIQVKGRDIFGMMKILPGVSDTTFSRDYAAWQSGRGLSINGGTSLNKNTTIDGVPVGEEGGDGTTHVTPNLDSIGEVTVITNGYTAENGRQSSGLIRIVTKSGTNQLKGSAWYNARRDEWNANDYFRKKQGAEKPFFEVDISRLQHRRPGGHSEDSSTAAQPRRNSSSSSRRSSSTMSGQPRCCGRTCRQRPSGGATSRRLAHARTARSQPIIDPLTGQAFPGNIIPQDRIHPMGQQMLNLLPLPNGVINQAAGQQWTSNDAQDTTPIHKRRNFIMRIDTVLSPSQRFSVRSILDRDDSITFNRVAPGVGSHNNVFPGDFVSGSHSKVLSSSMVNEMSAGFSHNHYGFRVGTGELNHGGLHVVLPVRTSRSIRRGSSHSARTAIRQLSRINVDEYPYMPDILFLGGNRSNLARWRPWAGNTRPGPTWNENYRYTFQNDLSWTKGRHNMKFGFVTERDAKTEPGSATYTGVYDFGHSGDNPLSTGNGYANALLGYFTRYEERTNRVDRERRHWQTDFYAQDTWRMTPRMTLDYGLRVAHHGAIYEVRDMNSAFDPALFDPTKAPVFYEPYCTTGVSGTQACAAANRRARNPLTGEVVAYAYQGTTVPGSGSISNGMFRGGLPGKKAGWYYDMPYFSYGPRVGFAWDLTGDGKTAIRAAGGIFYNFLNQGQYAFDGGPLITQDKIIRAASIDDVAAFGQAGTQFAETPQQTGLPDGLPAGHARTTDDARQAAARNLLSGERRLPARYRFQHHRRNRVGRQLRAQLLAPEGLEQHRAHTPTPIRTISSTPNRSPSTRCGAITWGSATFGIWTRARRRSTTTRCN